MAFLVPILDNKDEKINIKFVDNCIKFVDNKFNCRDPSDPVDRLHLNIKTKRNDRTSKHYEC